MPDSVFLDLLTWLDQALGSGNVDHRLLTAAQEWSIGLAATPALLADGEGVILLFRKPNGEEGYTVRVVDPALVFVAQLHCVAGGRMTVEPHGPGGDYYYTRLYFPGHKPGGNNRRVYISRLIAGTMEGDFTKESPVFHNMRRAKIGWRGRTDKDSTALHGREDARQWTLDAAKKVVDQGERLAGGVTPERIGEMIDAGYQLLDKVPLGFDHR